MTLIVRHKRAYTQTMQVKSRVLTEGPEFDAAMASFVKAEQERSVWDSMWPDLVERYPRQFVARVGVTIVAVRSDLVEMSETLDALGLQPPDDVAVEYIYDGSEKFIL